MPIRFPTPRTILAAASLGLVLLGPALVGATRASADDAPGKAETVDAAAMQWPHWRGPEMNGISRETGLVDEWNLTDKKNVLWVSEIGGRATPIVMNGRVFLNCKTEHNAADPRQMIDARQQVVCWDAETGDVLWKDVFNVAQTDIPHPRVGWAAMTGDLETGNVYAHTVDSQLRCYSADGKLQWQHDMTAEYGTITGYGGRTQTPIIDEDRLIVSFLAANWGDTKGPAPKHFYYAFDKHDGKLLWTAAPGGAPEDTNYSCPVVAVVNGTRMLIGGNADGGVYAMQARTGKPIWGFRMSKRGLNASVVVDGDRVYATHGEDNIDTNAFGRVTCIDATMTGDITPEENVPGKSGGQIWRVNDLKAGYASPLVVEGIMYVVDDGGDLFAYDAENGELLWKHDLGTVGKGSPVWADGKIYVMEVGGNVHIVEPSREGCKQLSKVSLPGVDARSGSDEIYASPAISQGRVYFCTRDRMICIGNPDTAPASNPIPPMPEEKAPENPGVAAMQLVPYEVMLKAGESTDYELLTFDANGRFLETVDPTLALGEGLDGATVDGLTLKTDGVTTAVAGTVVATYEGQKATARARVFPPLPWSWDFTGLKGVAVPPTWVRAHIRLKPFDLDGEPVMLNGVPPSRPSVYIWFGPTDMQDYVVQSDFRFDGRRRLSYAGVSNRRYNFIAKANTNELEIQSWAPHLRMAKTVKMKFEPEAWYTMKFQVDVEDGTAICRGKIWPRDEEEPAEWTLETEDPHPSPDGSPGLFFYSLSDTYVDNVTVTDAQ